MVIMKRKPYQTFLIYVGLIAVMVFFLGPIAWFWALSLRSPTSAFAQPPQLHFKPTLAAFKYTFVDPGVNAPQLKSSLIVAIGGTLLMLPFAVAAAYALSRFHMRAKAGLMMWYISLLMAPPVVFLIPYFILMSRLKLRGTYASMIILSLTITIPLSIWLLKSFFDDVPFDIEEAALVDGASFLQSMRYVTLPLSMPGIIVTSMFAFVFTWNNTIFPLVLSNQSTSTLPIGTLNYFATTGVTWNYIAATAVVTMLPPMIVFLVLGRYIVRGLTFGAVKG
jgi:multiple sugar transport system permease protein